jgi:NitT/TauT family transport system substrate-binding protein
MNGVRELIAGLGTLTVRQAGPRPDGSPERVRPAPREQTRRRVSRHIEPSNERTGCGHGAGHFALVLLGIALVAANAAPAGAQTTVRFSLNGPFQGPEAVFFVPQDKGYFKSSGLEVLIDEALSAVDPIVRVASGTHELGFADINDLIKYRDQHQSAPVKAIFVVYNKPPYSVVARKSRGITEPKQIESKKLGATPTGSSYAQWPLFAKLNAIDVSKVTIENIATPVRAPMLAAGQIDAALGSSFRLYVDVKERGVPLDDLVLMPMADYGMRLYGSAIIANAKFAAEKPDAVKAFLRAFTRGLKESIRHPAEAVETIIKRNDASRKATELERLRMAIRDNIVTREVIADGVGGVDPARLNQSIEQIALVYAFKDKAKAGDAFDAEFLPPAGERKID